ncbi:hypothetical protein BT93_D1620 [Corymbia citriodora subsp. variegata]|nr:hypothetical protein BT93_D1620 [Corymbia citriodora subsp. variegata]
MSLSSGTDLSRLDVPDQDLTVQIIIDRIIPCLLDFFHQVKERIIPPQIDKSQGLSDGSDRRGQDTKKEEKKKKPRSYSYGKEATGDDVHDDYNLQLGIQIDRLNRDLGYVKDSLHKLKKIEDSVGMLIKTLVERSKDAAFLDSLRAPGATDSNLNEIQVQLTELTDVVTKLKLHIPSSHKITSSTSDAHRAAQVADELGDCNIFKEMRNFAIDGKLLVSSVWKDFHSTYERLDIELQLCLLCFALFPEHAVIKKRVMYYWWVGEWLIDPGKPSDSKNKAVGNILKKFVDEGFIHPVVRKRRIVIKSKSYMMLPFIRSMVVSLAKEAEFLDFDSSGYPTLNLSKCLRSCLVKSEGSKWQGMMDKAQISDLEKLHALFNVNEPYLDFKEEWFSNMKNINLLSLGSWQGSKHDHIEVENTEFLWGMKHMTSLKFFSLQGISRITEPPKSIGKLYNLRILDLRDCHNLESLPNEICSLKELINLDVSGCYLIEYMPKGLDSLSKLEVLMGFVVSDLKSGSYSTLSDLAKLKKLRKLGISTTRKSFPTEEELMTLQKFGNLLKLTIAWGGNSISEKDKGADSAVDDPIKSKGIVGSFPFKKRTTQKPTIDDLKLPQNLEKLDLLCYPSTVAPKWLMPGKLENLKSLYVRGGYLQHLGRVQEDKKWKVKTMRLKFLKELAMDWREMRQSFPDLVCLQMVDCPRLTLFPCDKNGVRLKEQFSESNYKN